MLKEVKLRLKNNLNRKDRSLSVYLAIAVRAAREARLLHLLPGTDEEARSLVTPLLIDHTAALKTAWLRQPNGGIRGWQRLLTLLGFRERLTVERVEDGLVQDAATSSRRLATERVRSVRPGDETDAVEARSNN